MKFWKLNKEKIFLIGAGVLLGNVIIASTAKSCEKKSARLHCFVDGVTTDWHQFTERLGHNRIELTSKLARNRRNEIVLLCCQGRLSLAKF